MAFPIASPHQLGPTLRGLRKQRQLSQIEVAKLSGLGQKTISLLETAPHRCSFDSLSRYLAAIRVTLSLDLAELAQSARSEEW